MEEESSRVQEALRLPVRVLLLPQESGDSSPDILAPIPRAPGGSGVSVPRLPWVAEFEGKAIQGVGTKHMSNSASLVVTQFHECTAYPI